MNSPLARSGVAALLISFAGCAKAPEAPAQPSGATVGIVPDAERSRHFDAVNRHLELGGTLYGYADVDGDAMSLAGGVQAFVRQLASVQPQLAQLGRQDFKALFSDLGLNDVKAVGFSSVREAGGTFRNRTFLYTPDGRHGLFAAFGGQPGRFLGEHLAPPDCDFYCECEFDVSALYDTLREVEKKVGGPDAAAALEKSLKGAGADSGFSVLDVIQGLTGRMTIIVRMDPDRTFATPGPNSVKIPAFSAIVRVEGIGSAVVGALEKNPQLAASRDGPMRLFSPSAPSPVAGIEPVLAVDGKTFYAATSGAFLSECLKRTAGLETNADFAGGLAALGPDGNGLTWITPRFFARIREIGDMNPQAAPQQKSMFDLAALHIPVVTRPLFSVRSNLPDGILVRSDWNQSLKANVAMFTVYNPVTVGLMAAMAIPAFQKVREASQDKAVLNNLVSLDAAANDFYMINGVSSATYSDLVGPDKLVKELHPVAGEDYTSLTFEKGRSSHIRLPGGRVITDPRVFSAPPAAPSAAPKPEPAAPTPDARPRAYDQLGVVNNLYTLDQAAKKYFLLYKVDTATYAELVGPDKLVKEIDPVAGEDYSQLVFARGQRVEVHMADGRVIRYPLGSGPISAPAAARQSAPQQARAPTDAKGTSILENLQILDAAANKYYSDNDATSTTFEQLVGPEKYIASVRPIEGEDYRSLLFKKGHPLRLYMKDGSVIVYPPPPPPQPAQ
jgi:hypothetical protein